MLCALNADAIEVAVINCYRPSVAKTVAVIGVNPVVGSVATPRF